MPTDEVKALARIVVEQGHEAEYNDELVSRAIAALYPAVQYNEVRQELKNFSYLEGLFGKISARFVVAILLLCEGDLARLKDFPKPQDYPEIHGLIVTVRTIFVG